MHPAGGMTGSMQKALLIVAPAGVVHIDRETGVISWEERGSRSGFKAVLKKFFFCVFFRLLKRSGAPKFFEAKFLRICRHSEAKANTFAVCVACLRHADGV
jgi:hypothetical protein